MSPQKAMFLTPLAIGHGRFFVQSLIGILENKANIQMGMLLLNGKMLSTI